MITFDSPLFFLIIAAFLILYAALRFVCRERSFLFSSMESARRLKGTFRSWAAGKMVLLRIAAIVLIGVALARPQIPAEERSEREGIAIVIAIDSSSTMLAEDLQLGSLGLTHLVEDGSASPRLNRLGAVKMIAREFIDVRQDDMIGIVAFAAQAYIVCPPTYDHEWLLSSLDRVNVGMMKDGTAIGSGILSSLDALKDINAKSKAIILLTDGINNFGEVPPLVAAGAARALGIKIYTIGIASRVLAPFPTKDIYGKKMYQNIRIDLDEATLKKMAQITGGSYYRVSDMTTLKESYREIDKLEKAVLKESTFNMNKDIFSIAAYAALLVLLLEIIFSNTHFRKIP